jgi:hypothetical protein
MEGSMSRQMCGIVFVLMLFISGCAKVSVLPIDPTTGMAKPNAQEGVRYFLPRPYLLVMEVPVESSVDAGKTGGAAPTSRAVGSNAAGTGTQASTTPSDSSKGSGGSPSPTSDTSFSMFTKQYGVKLVYLPDFEKPMAISENPGLFGTASMKPSLTDGWMLTSLDASGDSKTAETIGAVASLIGSLTGAGGGSAAKGATTKATGGGAPGVTQPGAKPPPSPNVLEPGLYRLDYDPVTGKLTGICAVAYFKNGGVQTPNDLDPNRCK